MLSISSAANLIANSDSPTALDALLPELGFSLPARALDEVARTRMTLPEEIIEALVARGIGSLRALIITITPNTPARDIIIKTASRLSTRIPDLLWLIIARQQNSPLFAVATWSAHTSPPKVTALITSRSAPLESDAETLCRLASTPSIPNDLLQHSRWLETLGRQSVTHRFYKALERATHTLANSLTPAPPTNAANTIALLYTSRILFLAFIETKGWLNNDFGFLINGFANCMTKGGSYHRTVLEPLFFGTLNTRPINHATRAHAFGKVPFLNGGLFARTPIERQFRNATLPDDALSTLYGDVLARFRLTAREDSPSWSEAAVDPEMLGKVFESLMTPKDRKRSGAFYTPQSLVEHTTRLTLIQALQSPKIPQSALEDTFAGHLPSPILRGLILDRISQFSILDPACGSGAFLVHSLELLSSLRAQLGDLRPISAIRRAVLISSIHGVDINPIAVWLCELRLWLSVVIENTTKNPMHVLPLPNLDHNIRVGNSLTGSTFDPSIHTLTSHSLSTLRQRYARASGPRKKSLAKLLANAERTRAIKYIDRAITKISTERKDLITLSRSPDLFAERHLSTNTRHRLSTIRQELRSLRTERKALTLGAALPFSFATHFPDAADTQGFSAIIGNPPWVRPHHIPTSVRQTLRISFFTLRNAAWKSGASNVKADTGFAAQVDLAALFLEQATHLLTPQGALGFLLPAKLWRSLAGGGTRHLITTQLQLSTLEDLSNAPPTFDAATYPSLIVARKTHSKTATPTTITVHHPSSTTQWKTPLLSIALDSSPGAPWLLIPPKVRHAFTTLSQAGIPLAHSLLGRPLLGVKSGCNDAFIVNADLQTSPEHPITTITSGSLSALIERHLLRPLLRGAVIRQWSTPPSNTHIIWTHSPNGPPLTKLPPYAHHWFASWQRQLERRSDCRSHPAWWSLFRTEAANTSSPRVTWSDFGTSPRATLIDTNDPTVPLNSCYVVPCPSRDDALALTALLNSPIIAAFLDVIAEPAQNSYRRYLGWTMALIPIPHNWIHARSILAPIAHQAIHHSPPSPESLTEATLQAYDIPHSTITSLMEWTNRKTHQ